MATPAQIVMDQGTSTDGQPPPYEEIFPSPPSTTGRTDEHDEHVCRPCEWFDKSVRQEAQRIFDTDPKYQVLKANGIAMPSGGNLWTGADEAVKKFWMRFGFWDERWDKTGKPDITWPHERLRSPRSPTPLFGTSERRRDPHDDGSSSQASRPRQQWLAELWQESCKEEYNTYESPDEWFDAVRSAVATKWKDRGFKWPWPGNIPGPEWPPRGRRDYGSPERQLQQEHHRSEVIPRPHDVEATPLLTAPSQAGRIARPKRKRGDAISDHEPREQRSSKRPRQGSHEETPSGTGRDASSGRWLQPSHPISPGAPASDKRATSLLSSKRTREPSASTASGDGPRGHGSNRQRQGSPAGTGRDACTGRPQRVLRPRREGRTGGSNG